MKLVVLGDVRVETTSTGPNINLDGFGKFDIWW